MANITDVCNALIAQIAQTLYPSGTGQASVAGFGIRVFEGWPNPQALDADLLAGVANVSVYPTASERNTSRYPRDWQQASINAATLTATIVNQTITIGGTISTPQNVSAVVNNQAFVYAVQAGDTLTSIATGLTALIVASVAGATSSGAVITLPTGAKIQSARVGVVGTSLREIRRQERVVQITIWANSPQNRDLVANPIDIALANTNFLTLADGTAARAVYKNSPMVDTYQKSKLYRRDFNYSIEYATTETATDTQVIVLQENVSSQLSGVSAPIAISTVQINT